MGILNMFDDIDDEVSVETVDQTVQPPVEEQIIQFNRFIEVPGDDNPEASQTFIQQQNALQDNEDPQASSVILPSTERVTKLSPLDALIASASDNTQTGFKVNGPIQLKEDNTIKNESAIVKEREDNALIAEGEHLDSFTLMMRRCLKRLGLGEGDFVDEEIREHNGTVTVVPANAILGKIIAQGEFWSDEELDAYVSKHYVEGRKIDGKLYPKETFAQYEPDNTESYDPVDISQIETNILTDNTPSTTTAEPVKQTSPAPSATNTPKIDSKQNYESAVNIVIDKQNVGGELNFTDEEMDKIQQASKIVLNVISKTDVFEGKKVIKARDITNVEMTPDHFMSNRVPCNLAASRYHCEVSGLSYIELNEIGMHTDETVLANENKIWSIIYEHVHNPSIGAFADYNDFLKKTAYTDANLLIYHMLCASTPETDDVQITCQTPVWKKYDTFLGTMELKAQVGVVDSVDAAHALVSTLPETDLVVGNYILISPTDNAHPRERYVIVYDETSSAYIAKPYQVYRVCNTTYHHKYQPRDILDPSKYSQDVLAQFSMVKTATSVQEALDAYKESLLATHKMITLPDSKAICEIGLKSAHDVLVTFNSYMVGDRLSRRYRRRAIRCIKEDTNYELIFRTGLPDNPDQLSVSQKEIVDQYITSNGWLIDIQIIGLLAVISSIYVLNGDTYIEFDEPGALIDIFKKLTHADFAVLANTANNIIAEYEPEGLFSYRGCKCPKCGTVVDVPVDSIKTLVFQVTRSISTTEVDVSNLLKD